MARRSSAAALLFACTCTLGLVARQSSQTTFRSAVDLVDVEVSVLDKYRLPVRGLTAADFTVLEDGKPRPIAAFTPVDLPGRVLPEAAWMNEVSPDVHSNTFSREGRLVVIMLDTSTDAVDAMEARRIAEAAVNQLRPNDMAAIAWSLPGVPQNFTTDRQRLLDVIQKPSLNVANASPGASGLCPCGATACAMEAIATVAEGIQDVGWRRKILFVIGRRLTGRGAGGGGCGAVVEASRTRALRAAEAGNLTINVIDPHGVATLSSQASSAGPNRPPPGAEVRRIQGLRAVTNPTGGRLVIRNDPSVVVPEVFRESDSYYVLGFEPAYTRKDGRFVRIEVKVNRPDVTLQSRRGYYAAGRRPRPLPDFGKDVPVSLAASIAGLWPKTDAAISVSAAPVAVPGVRGGAVVVLMKAKHQLPPSWAKGQPLPRDLRVNVLTGAFDSNGQSRGLERQVVSVTPRETGDGWVEYDIASRLVLKPGRYEIRTAIEPTQSAAIQQSGSAYTYVDVPDFSTRLVSLSGMFVQAGGRGSVTPGARLDDILPVVPTTRRTFRQSDAVIAFVREYQSNSRTFMPGYAVTEIFDRTDTRVYRQEQRLVPESPDHRGIDFLMPVPVDRLEPGPYLLKFEVRHGNETAQQNVRFEIE